MGAPDGANLPGILLWQASKLWQRTLNNQLGEIGLSSTSGAVLASVLYHDEQGQLATQASIAQATKIDVMTASRILRALESKELIVRRASPSDTRANISSITLKGRQTAHEAIKRIALCATSFFEHIANDHQHRFVADLQELIAANDSAAAHRENTPIT
jgi:DNA-binding MarR family transcriptional regulator